MVVTIISTIVLLNSRKYEIAILRSAGMKKRRLILNYLLENIFFVWGITIISFIVSAFISNIFINDILSDSPLSANNINVNFLLQNAGLVFGGTTAVVMLSLVLACVNIVRFEPLKIFNKQY